MCDEERKYEQLLEQASNALQNIPVPSGPPPEIVEKVLAAGEGFEMSSKTYRLKERFKAMKHISKIAAVFLIVAGIVGLIAVFTSGTRSNIAFADVIEPIMTARTIVFNAVAGKEKEEETFQIKVMNMGTQRVRQEIYIPKLDTRVTVILDLETLKQLSLVPKEKAAVYIDIKGVKEKPPNYLEMIRNLISKLDEEPAFTVENLGRQKVDGQEAIAFHAAGPGMELTIWADPETALPIKIEQKQKHIHVVCTDFHFNTELDASLFSMEVPEGYNLIETEIDVTGSTEKELIEALRIWAEMLLEGTFPNDFSRVEFINKMVPVLQEREKTEESKVSDEEKMQLGLKINKGLMFVELNLVKHERDWHYVGGGVKFGDAEQPVCWYRPKDSETYHVIYGDLSVREVPSDELPEVNMP